MVKSAAKIRDESIGSALSSTLWILCRVAERFVVFSRGGRNFHAIRVVPGH